MALKPPYMKNLLLLLACLPATLLAQTTWEVEAGGSMLPGNPAPYYSPADITINVGDAVHWTAVSGTHNVYGMLDAFPANPEGFTSGDPSSNLNYTHTFTIPGLYGYHCTQNGHAATQHGTINVVGTEDVGERSGAAFSLYPSPAHGQLTVVLAHPGTCTAEVLGVSGQVLGHMELPANGQHTVPVNGLQPGTYFLRLTTADGNVAVRPFVKQ